MERKKRGRPTESKKEVMLRTRIDSEDLKKLEKVSEVKKLSKSEVVRVGIELQYDEITNNKGEKS